MLHLINKRESPLPATAIVVVLLSIVLASVLPLGNQWINIGLFGGLAVVLIGVVFYANRKIILILYLLTIVNLDYFKLLSEPFNLTIDILFSFTIMFLALPLFISGKLAWRSTPIQKAFLLYLAVTLVCVILSIEPLISFKRWLRYVNYFFLLCLIMDIARDRATIDNLTRVIIYASVIPCLTGYYGLFTRTSNLIGENLRFIYGIDMVRIKSTLSHANTFGLFLSLIISATIGFMLRKKERTDLSSNFFMIVVMSLAIPMLYFTYSRIGWIVTTLALLLILFLHKKWRLLTITPWIFLLILWRLPGLVTRWSDIIDTTQPDSLDWRWSLYVFSLNKFVNKPIFGSGPGTFLEYVSFGKGYSQHHLWIGSLVEVGVLGTLAYAILFAVVWVQLIKFARTKPTALNFLALAIFSAMMIVSITGDPFDVPSVVIYLWALISLAVAEYRLKNQEPSNKVVPI